MIRGGAIGDFILTLPAIAALRRQFPEAHLEVLGYPHIIQLALAGGLVNRVQSIEARALAGFFARGGELLRGPGGLLLRVRSDHLLSLRPGRDLQEPTWAVARRRSLSPGRTGRMTRRGSTRRRSI